MDGWIVAGALFGALVLGPMLVEDWRIGLLATAVSVFALYVASVLGVAP